MSNMCVFVFFLYGKEKEKCLLINLTSFLSNALNRNEISGLYNETLRDGIFQTNKLYSYAGHKRKKKGRRRKTQ